MLVKPCNITLPGVLFCHTKVKRYLESGCKGILEKAEQRPTTVKYADFRRKEARMAVGLGGHRKCGHMIEFITPPFFFLQNNSPYNNFFKEDRSVSEISKE